ncbi:3-oxoacyl-[acyl-carrier-protein] reductase FabG [Phycisphaerae bacterium RAS1]|nr:3-oxoacyl-[acyl-carrier-protein] reductase FabG [Phycisphaerae bacterium RAS1]
MGPLAGKVALVTGASRGIGRAIAIALAERGADVAVNYSSHGGPAEDVCEAIHKLGRKAITVKANIANDAENHSMVSTVQAELGPIGVLVNNAGITRDKSFAKMTYEIWKEVLDVDLTGPAMVTHECLPSMVEAGWGRVVFITSVIGQMGNFGQSNYAVAKGGLISLTRTLARETARKGVTVNAVAPGFIETDMTSVVAPAALEAIKSQTPVGRLGKPEEVAHAVCFLASPIAAFITGEVINVNGGLYMG